MKYRVSKFNILMCTVAVLLCATLFSMHLVGGLYAKYTNTASGSDSARVAKFSITQSGEIINQNIKVLITPGSNNFDNITLEIKNNSEVAVAYTLTVTNATGNLPLKFTLTQKSGTTTPISTPELNGKVSISKASQVPGTHTDTYQLSIVWDNTTPDEQSRNLELIGMVDYVTVSVAAVQID